MIKIKSRYAITERIIITTPGIGEKGDMTDRTFVGDCDVDSILRKYGTVNYKRFTSADCADVSELPVDRLEMEVMMENVRAAHKEFGGEMDINEWVASLFKKKDEKPVEKEPVEKEPVEKEPVEKEPVEKKVGE